MDQPVRRALLSVSDKTGLTELARALTARHIEILSTGGTARLLADSGIKVLEVADYTGFPEIMDGRVKTLHPKIHGGLLGRRGVDEAVMAEHGIGPIDLLVVNLYPFAQTIARPDASHDDAIENIDIGGPAMLRAAAKNHAAVTVLVDPTDYAVFIAELDGNEGRSRYATRARLAAKAFAHTASYDTLVADYLNRHNHADAPRFPASLTLSYTRIAELRYGENPHQKAAFYRAPGVRGANIAQAYENAYRTDPTSAFGGIIAFNQPLDAATARLILERQFVEVLLATALLPGAKEALAAKPNVRVLVTGDLVRPAGPQLEYRSVNGGLLAQDSDAGMVSAAELHCVTRRAPTASEQRDLEFAWRVCKFVKSNAIVYARDEATIGVGAGQMSRVYSSRIAAIKAEDASLSIKGAVMASDAFFPFRDGLEVAAAFGIAAVIQPGGSRRDDEVIAAANELGLAMLFTGMRHFRH